MPSHIFNPFCNPSFGLAPNDPFLYLERGEPSGAGGKLCLGDSRCTDEFQARECERDWGQKVPCVRICQGAEFGSPEKQGFNEPACTQGQ